MHPYETRWSRVLPYAMGIFFGLSVALLVVSIVMFRRAAEREPAAFTVGDTLFELAGGDAIIAARRVVSPAVVSITAYKTRKVYAQPRSATEWLMQYYGRSPRVVERKYPSLGSGFIVRRDGYILTNEHVVSESDEIYVILSDSSEVLATLVGASAEFDLALLKIEGGDLPYAVLGDSDKLEIGEQVIAIGSPFPYLFYDTQPTVTLGVVSAMHRDVVSGDDTEAVFKNMIQTDAAINPGNSGGPLVSSRGAVVGVNTFVFTGGQGAIGMGFAIPINTARMVMDELIRYGRFRYVWTGLYVDSLTPEIAARVGAPFETGLFIARVDEGGPAALAGMQVGDVVDVVNGMRIRTLDQANRAIFGLRVGDRLPIAVFRDGERIELDLELVEKQRGA